MIYIFTTLSILCALCLFIETELQKCSVTYKNGELKIIKHKDNKIKVYKGWIVRVIYKIFC